MTRGKRIFGWGWVAHPSQAIEEVTLRLERRRPGDAAARPLRPPARRCGDVRFRSCATRAASGFVVTGCPHGDRGGKLVSSCAWKHGGDRGSISRSGGFARRRAPKSCRELPRLARAAWRRLRRGDLRGIVRRAVRRTTRRLRSTTSTSSQRRCRPFPPNRAVCRRLRPQHGRRREPLSARADRRTPRGRRDGAARARTTCPRSTIVSRLPRRAPTSRSTGCRRFWSSSAMLERGAGRGALPQQPGVVRRAARCSPTGSRRCGSSTPDAARRQPPTTTSPCVRRSCCSTPTAATAGFPTCRAVRSCLPRHRASYVTLSPPTTIAVWRASWGRCLAAADEVRCFSDSTRAPAPARPSGRSTPARLTVVPHRVDYRAARGRPRSTTRPRSTIGIVGHISAQKGALVVRDVLARIDREPSATPHRRHRHARRRRRLRRG